MNEISLNIPGIKVLRLEEKHLDQIIELMNKEGWYYYDHHELLRYLDLNQDCFTLFKDQRIVGSIFTTNYGNQAWIGNLLVAEESRGSGLATGLLKEVMDYLHKNRHVLTFRLGSVPLAIGLYKKMGFHPESFTTSQEVKLPINLAHTEIDLGTNVHIERLEPDDLRAISEIDKKYFKSERIMILSNLYEDSIRDSCFCLKDGIKIAGYIMMRRRQVSKTQGGFSEGPDHVYRVGPSCVLPEYGINGFKALFQEAIYAVDRELLQLKGAARMYAVFPKNADKENIFRETRELNIAMGKNENINLDRIFDEHEHIFTERKSPKNEDQWNYMANLGFDQEYFEQVMSYTIGEALNTQPANRYAEETRADTQGIFAYASPGDKA